MTHSTKILRNKQADFATKPPTKPILWADFERKYLSREDGFKYEWLNGTIEKTSRTMHQSQRFIQHFLNRFILTMAVFVNSLQNIYGTSTLSNWAFRVSRKNNKNTPQYVDTHD